jgi:CCR4-NOT transcription complex subunit 4
LPNTVQAKADRKAAKKAAAAERALERQRQAQETRAAKKAKVARGKSTEKEAVASPIQAEEDEGKRITQAAVKDEKSVVREHIDGQCPVIAGTAIPTGEVISDRAKGVRLRTNLNETPKSDKRTKTPIQPTPATKQSHLPIKSDPSSQLPLLSKKPKKVKPVSKSSRLQKDEDVFQDMAGPLHQLELAVKAIPIIPLSPANSLTQQSPTSLEELLEEIDLFHPGMDLPNHPFFDVHTLTTAAKMPLEYGPLVHALSALSVGGGSFANNMPSGSIDNAVSSFQQLLETLTQTISDLLRLLPRTTWDDSSSFDGVLRDMLKGDDFLEDGSDEGQGKEDEVAALTLALERRARWMEVQLSKLEELHRDINTAAVRAVLSFNDNGWDKYGFLPRSSNALRRFDNIGVVEDAGIVRPMTAQELEKKLAVATEAAAFAEAEVREAMENLQAAVPG